MSGPQPTEEPDPALEELVAYLDGELDVEQSASVEQRLADDVSFRQKLQQLQQTWDLLDHLPRASASGTFTQSTVELVAVSAEDDVKQHRDQRRTARSMGWVLTAVIVCVAAFTGYAIVNRQVTSDNRQLLQDLPVIENYDMYLHADSLDFLLLLEQEELFTEELEEDEVVGTL